MKPIFLLKFCPALFLLPGIVSSDPILEFEAGEFRPYFQVIPAPLILATGEPDGAISNEPLVFVLGGPGIEEVLTDGLPGYEIDRHGPITMAIHSEVAELLDSIILPEIRPSVSQSLPELNQARVTAFNESQEDIYLMTGTMDLVGGEAWNRTLIEHRNRSESLLTFLTSVVEQVPRHSVLIQVEPFSTQYINPEQSERISAVGYEWSVLVNFGHVSTIEGVTWEEATALRYFNATGRTDFADILEMPELLSVLLLSKEASEAAAGKTFLQVYTTSSPVLHQSLSSVTNPIDWATGYILKPLTLAGRFTPRGGDPKLYSILTDESNEIPKDLAVRGAWYLAYANNSVASSYISELLKEYPSMNDEQTDHFIRAILLLPEDKRPAPFDENPDLLWSLLQESGPERYEQLHQITE